MWSRSNFVLNFFYFRFRNHHILKPTVYLNCRCNLQWQSTIFHTGFFRQNKIHGEFLFKNVTQHNAIHIPDPFPVFWATPHPLHPHPPPRRQNPSIFCRAKHISPRNIFSSKFPALSFNILKSKRLCHRLKVVGNEKRGGVRKPATDRIWFRTVAIDICLIVTWPSSVFQSVSVSCL